MITKRILFIGLISGIFFLTGCISAKDTAFAYLIPAGDMNGSIKLQMWNPDEASSLRNGDKVSLALSNASYYDVSMPEDFGMYVLRFDEAAGEWKDVGYELLNHGGMIERGSEAINVQIRPQVESSNEPVEIRVVVLGDMASTVQSKQVGAYIDLTLQP